MARKLAMMANSAMATTIEVLPDRLADSALSRTASSSRSNSASRRFDSAGVLIGTVPGLPSRDLEIDRREATMPRRLIPTSPRNGRYLRDFPQLPLRGPSSFAGASLRRAAGQLFGDAAFPDFACILSFPGTP